MLKGKSGATFVRRHAGHIFAVKIKRGRRIVGIIQSADDPQQRRFAGTGRPEQRDEFAGLDLEAHVVQRRKRAEFFRDILTSTLIMKFFLRDAATRPLLSTHAFNAIVTNARNVSSDATANAPVES